MVFLALGQEWWIVAVEVQYLGSAKVGLRKK
jgi:hypothetical protein